MRWSDDGEPGGTSGQPTLNVFRSAGVCDVCCVVTRYFGGILLGSGGLVRAYSKAASMALEAAGRARMAEWSVVETVCGYAQYERVRRLLADLGARRSGGLLRRRCRSHRPAARRRRRYLRFKAHRRDRRERTVSRLRQRFQTAKNFFGKLEDF